MIYDYSREDHDVDDATCKYCGAEGLTWVHTGVRYRLVGDNGFHVCPSVATADDFDEVK